MPKPDDSYEYEAERIKVYEAHGSIDALSITWVDRALYRIGFVRTTKLSTYCSPASDAQISAAYKQGWTAALRQVATLTNRLSGDDRKP